ncbi:MAG: Rrf2 family transcriptional regulator [Campylobacterales bacterium]|nr:Rrf2 family transcriptional regulator [Campylobacterales bacterium]
MFSKTAQYTFRFLIFMSKDPDQLYSASHVHEETKIPYKYLTMLMTKLAKSKILKVTRGRNGGFTLNHSLSEISLADILDAISENTCSHCALGDKKCEEYNPCPLHETYAPPKKALEEMLANTTLALLDPSLLLETEKIAI